MDARHFKAPYLRRTGIWKVADELRQRLLPQNTLPLPVLDLAEFDLGLELHPKANLRRAGDIDALLLGDLRTIFVDRDAFMDPRAENRLRFSVAHEIGHPILHRELYRNLSHASFAAWKQFFTDLPEREYGWLESHAYEFAGRFLVPPAPLRESLNNAVETARSAGFTEWDASGETALGFIANHICRRFGVSAEVIARRLRIEEFWPPEYIHGQIIRHPIRASCGLFRLPGRRRSRAGPHRHAHRAKVRCLGGSSCQTIARGRTWAWKNFGH